MPIHNVPRPITTYISRAVDAQLAEQLRNQTSCIIEMIGPTGSGKTTLVRNLIFQNLNDRFESYELIGWIDCTTADKANSDIIELSRKLGRSTQNPEEAARTLIGYCEQHPKQLLVLDGLNEVVLRTLAFVEKAFKLSEGQLVYTAARSLQPKIKEIFSLELDILPITVSPFETSEVRQLVTKWCPNKLPDNCDFYFLTAFTGGHPGMVKELCQHYLESSQYKDFEDFLSRLKRQGSLSNELLKKSDDIIEKEIAPLESAASSSPTATRALSLLKQAAWLGEESIPFEFFVDDQQKTDYLVINSLMPQKNLAILREDRAAQTFRLIPVFRDAMQQKYQGEKTSLLLKNIERLSQVFSYLINNEGQGGKHSKPEALRPYADLVASFLFKVYQPNMLPQNSYLTSKLLALGSSLARYHYMTHGKLKLAHDYLKDALVLLKDGLSDSLIEQFQRDSDLGVTLDLPKVSKEEKELLTLYAQEYLYQMATISSQLLRRNQDNSQVIRDFKHAYVMQKNLQAEPSGIAYTIRNLTRALRKASQFKETSDWYERLRNLITKNPFDPVEAAELLVDEGIMLKEKEDAKAEGSRDYKESIPLFKDIQMIYEKHNQNGQCNPKLSLLALYRGEAYLANDQFEEGINSVYQMLYYDRQAEWKEARVYFALAQAFHKEGYEALASLYVEKAYPLQHKDYKPVPQALKDEIESKLLTSYPESLVIDPKSPAVVFQGEKSEIENYCETALLNQIDPSKVLSRDQIKKHDYYYHIWLYRQKERETQQAIQAEVTLVENNLQYWNNEENNWLELRKRKQDNWYCAFAKRIDLNNKMHRNTHYFAEELAIALLTKIKEKIQLINNTGPMRKSELTTGLLSALTHLMPEVGFAITPVTFTISLAEALSGIIQTLADHHDKAKKESAKDTLDKQQVPEGSQEKIGKQITEQFQNVSEYVARCYDPLLSPKKAKGLTESDIKMLADKGAHRIIEYNYSAVEKKLHPNERAILALRKEQPNSGELKSIQFSVKDFFEKPGIKIEGEDSQTFKLYVNPQFYSSRYGFRWGSPTEVDYLDSYEERSENEVSRINSVKISRPGCCVIV